MDVNKRVELLIDKVASSKSSFAKATGISPVIISHICSGRNKVSLSAITQIIEAYPSISLSWLVMGKGEMFNTQNDDSKLLLEEIENLEKCQEKFISDFTRQIAAIRTKIHS